MTHKEQFKAEVEKVKLIIQSNRAKGAFAEGYLIGQESVLEHFENFVNSMQEYPVSEDLEEAATNYATHLDENWSTVKDGYIAENEKEAFYAGAKWQEQQLEKNRLARCDAQTEEEAEREQEFVMQHIKKYHCQPTFSDAIEWGMNRQREQMMKNAIEGV